MTSQLLRLEAAERRLDWSLTRAGFSTRYVHRPSLVGITRAGKPSAGDLLLANVVHVGHHPRIENTEGRKVQLYVGDTILVAYGNRYAPDQFEAIVSPDLEQCDLVAAGGIAGVVVSKHHSMQAPTRLQPIGRLIDADGRVANLAHWGLSEPVGVATNTPWTVVVAGTSMNSGKTTTVAGIIRGFAAAGMKVAAGKVTGTGAGGDLWSMADAGAAPVLDFASAGFGTTAGCSPDEVQRSLRIVYSNLAATSPDVIVLEIADGILQRETSALLDSDELRGITDVMVFAAREALGAMSGVAELLRRGLPVVAVSGLISTSPLASGEAQSGLPVPVLTLAELQAGSSLVGRSLVADRATRV